MTKTTKLSAGMMQMFTDNATAARLTWEAAPDGPEKEAAFVVYIEKLSLLHKLAEKLFGTRP